MNKNYIHVKIIKIKYIGEYQYILYITQKNNLKNKIIHNRDTITKIRCIEYI